MTKSYGTIPTETPEWSGSDVGTLRPWKEMVSVSFPGGFNESLLRIKINISYFHTNYAVIVLFVLFLSLLGRPVSLILFGILMAAWLFLYFLRDDPLTIFDCVVDERVVVIILSVVTVVFILTRATTSIVAGILVGVAVALLHSVLKKTGDLVLSNEEEGRGGVSRMHLKETASSSSFSSSL